MTDHITNAILSKVGNTLESRLGIKITFRESPNFNFSEEMKKALSVNNIHQDIGGDRKAMVLAIYKRTGISITQKGIRQRIINQHYFESDKYDLHGIQKQFMAAEWQIQARVACSLRDLMEGLETNYNFWVKPIAETNIAVELEDVDIIPVFTYTTEFSEDTGLDYADYPNYGPMYILTFTCNVIGNILLPQSYLYPKIKRVILDVNVGKEQSELLAHFEKEVR